MKYFVTGANGFIGSRLVERLLDADHKVMCLVRSPEKAIKLVNAGAETVVGDLHSTDILAEGMQGCDCVFHLAAYAKPWSKDKSLPFRINVEGTANVLKAALQSGVPRFVFTSSAAVIGPSGTGMTVDENTVRIAPYFNEYEETKAKAESLVKEYAGRGLHTVIVNPTRVFGPGPLSESNAVTKMLKAYCKGTWRILPGDGKRSGNYTFIDDMVTGHLLAAEKGNPGERYILGGTNLSFHDLFDIFAKSCGRKRILVPFPVSLMKMTANFLEFQQKITTLPPPITSPWVKKYLEDWNLSSDKAIRELGYSITPVQKAVDLTVSWIRQSKP
jgi:farnesol dehydrogenase